MEAAPSEQNHIFAVGQSYLGFQKRNKGVAPKTADELKTVLKSYGDPDELLISPRDKKPYEIVYNLSDKLDGFYVIAYEQEGVDGKRYMIQSDGRLWEATTEDLKKMKFPPGYKPKL